jgi:hypothetical protein
MGADERDDKRDDPDGFVADLLREATLTGTGDDPPPPAEPQAAAFPRRGDIEDNANTEDNTNTEDDQRRRD